MPRYQYQGTPKTPPPPAIALIAGNTTAEKAGTKYFWLQYRNRAGYSEVSQVRGISIAEGQGVSITIPASALPPSSEGVYVWEYAVLMGVDENPANSVVIATIPGREANEVTPTALPAAIALLQDEHFELGKAVASISQLPVSPINGMRRFVDELSQMVAWSARNSRWETVTPSRFTTYVPSAIGQYGSNRDIAAIDDPGIIIYPNYDSQPGVNGEPQRSIPVGFWLVNTESVPIPKATRLGITIELGAEDVSTAAGIVGGVQLTFLGYVNTITGERDTLGADGQPMPLLGIPIAYQGKMTGLSLPKDLQPNQAYLLSVAARFTTAHLNGRGFQGATLKISPEFYLNFATYNPFASITGSVIAAEGDLRRIVPSTGLQAIALDGSGTIQLPTGGGYSFFNVGQQEVSELLPDTDNQICLITINGDCVIDSEIRQNTAVRAYIGTREGIGKATAWSAPVTLNPSTVLTLAVTYPPAIRADYPDPIASSAQGQFNATWVVVYVQSVATGVIQRFDVLITPDSPSDQFIVGATAGVEIGSTLPVRASDRFGLFEPTNNSFTAGTDIDPSTFADGSYRVAIAYRYERTITSINHTAIGCIPEFSGTFGSLFSRSKYWAEGVADISGLRAVPAAERSPQQSRYVEAKGNPYRFNASGMAADDGDQFIRPLDILPTQPGRWQKDDSSQIYNGTEAPNPALGEVGDYYFLRSESGIASLHYKSGVATWDSILTLQGTKGDPGINNRGIWDVNSTYIGGDYVSRYSSGYVALIQNSGIDPELDIEGTTWQTVAQGISYKGEWSENSFYGKNNLVIRYAKIWLSLTINQGFDPDLDDGTNWQLIARGIRVRGSYSSFDRYDANDLVEYREGTSDDGSYLYINPISDTGYDPPNPDYWLAIAKDGAPGADGIDGRNGTNGTNGVNGADGRSLNPRGAYNGGDTYQRLDQVNFRVGGVNDGSYLYINATPSSGNAPPNVNFWQLLAKDGTPGAAGSVTSSTGALILDSTTVAPTTASNQTAIWNENGIVKLREPSNGASSAIAVLDKPQTFTKAQTAKPVALVDATSIAIDASAANYYTLTLGGNRTLANPTNFVAGTNFEIEIKQDGTGNRTLAYGTAYRFQGGTAPTLSTAANAVDILSCRSYDGTTLRCDLGKGY